MVNRYFKFELHRKYYIIFFVLIFSMLNFRVVKNTHLFEAYNIETYIDLLNESEFMYSSEMAEALEAEDYSLFLQNRIKYNQYMLDENYGTTLDQYINQKEIYFDSYLLNNNIKPLNICLDYNYLQGGDGVSALHIIIKNCIPLCIPFISLFITFKSLQDDRKAFNYLMSLPISKKDIVKTKWKTSIIMSFLTVVLTLVAVFVFGCILDGMGQFNYPITLDVMNLRNTTEFSFIPFWLFIFLDLIIILIQITVYVSIGTLFYKVVQNKWICYLVVLLIGMIPIINMIVFPTPMLVNEAVSLIPFFSDNAFHIITQGYSLGRVIGYFLIMLLWPVILYSKYMSKKSKGDFYEKMY